MQVKKAGVLLIVLILLMSTTVAFGGIEDKIGNHWSKGLLTSF